MGGLAAAVGGCLGCSWVVFFVVVFVFFVVVVLTELMRMLLVNKFYPKEFT